MIKSKAVLILGLSATVLLAGCTFQSDPNNPNGPKKMSFGTSNQPTTSQQWSYEANNVPEWKVASKSNKAGVSNFVFVPKKESIGNWNQNITEKYISAKTAGDSTLQTYIDNAKKFDESQCQKVDWKTISSSDNSIIYQADSYSCKSRSKKGQSQHVVGRLDKDNSGVYSLQYFTVDSAYNDAQEQSMLNTIQQAKLVPVTAQG